MKGTRPVYDFRHFRLDEAEQVLLCAGKAVPLTLKAFAVLLVLVENAGHLVRKDDLLRRIWPDAIVEEGNLAQAISALRRALGESHQSHQNHEYIETVPRRGYRFIAAVKRDPQLLLDATQPKTYLSEYRFESVNPPETNRQDPTVERLVLGYPGHRLYLKGNYYWNKSAVDGLNSSPDYSWRDLAVNPDVLPGGPADNDDAPSVISLPPGLALTVACLSNPVPTNGAQGEAHALLGLIRTFYDHDWPLAESDFKRGKELAVGSPLTYKHYGVALGMLGRFDEAILHLSRALATEPRSSQLHVGMGIVLFLARRFDAAMAQAQIALKLESEFYPAQVLLGISYLEQSRVAAGIAKFHKEALLASVGVTPFYPDDAYGVSGKRRQSLKIHGELEIGRSYFSHYALALAQAGLDPQEETLRLLQKTSDDPIGMINFIKLAADFDGLNSDQSFTALLSQHKSLK